MVPAFHLFPVYTGASQPHSLLAKEPVCLQRPRCPAGPLAWDPSLKHAFLMPLPLRAPCCLLCSAQTFCLTQEGTARFFLCLARSRCPGQEGAV